MAGSSESGARHFALNLAVLRRLFCTMAALLLFASQPLRAEPALERMSNPLRVATPGGNFSYYVAHEHSAQPRNALVVMHGHPRDAVKTLQAAIDAAQAAGAGGDIFTGRPAVPGAGKTRRPLPFRQSAPAARRRRPMALRLLDRGRFG